MLFQFQVQRDSVIHIPVSILFQILSPFRLLQNIEQSSLCYAIGPCWLFILNIVCVYANTKLHMCVCVCVCVCFRKHNQPEKEKCFYPKHSQGLDINVHDESHIFSDGLILLVQSACSCDKTINGLLRWNLEYLRLFKINISNFEFSNFQSRCLLSGKRSRFFSLTWQAHLYFLYCQSPNKEGFVFFFFHSLDLSSKRQRQQGTLVKDMNFLSRQYRVPMSDHIITMVTICEGAFPAGKKPTCQCRRLKRYGFNPWVERILSVRAWQPTPVFLPEESHGQRSLVGYRPWGHKRIRYN